MKFVFFTKGGMDIASSRCRAFHLSDYLNKKGLKSVVFPQSSILISKANWTQKPFLIISMFFGLFKIIKKNDVLYLQRPIYNKFYFSLLLFYIIFFKKIRNNKVIFDIDDAIFLHSKRKTLLLVKVSDFIFAGSRYIEKWLKKYSNNCYLVPTVVDFDRYNSFAIKKDKDNDRFTIGWVGNGLAHVENLEILVPVFRKIVNMGIKIKFILVGAFEQMSVRDSFMSIDGLEYVEFDWISEDDSFRRISMFDLGVMPLVNNKWNQGKCSFKVIEYMACEIPTIASNVGENKYLIKDGFNGFLVNNENDWVNKIIKIYSDKKLARKIGLAGAETIKNKYSLDFVYKKIINIID